ncbi:MAG TPA: sigma-70 family RNA polymerase sigma factor [Baekduia sp.]|nr:sigma-70 family RNA polymerase sigma factor [Baekduia sp.]
MATLAAPGVSATARSRLAVTDHDLVQAVRAGDDHAFERLYERYHRRISAYIFGMVHDHGRAEDLTQEVFVNALRRMRQTDRPIVFKPWIYEIAKNASIDAFRRSKRAEEISIDAQDGHGLALADHGKLHATGVSPQAAVEGKQELDHLCGAFGGLSDVHHQILVMRELEGLSYREIGERLGMSRPSVESTLFRARRRLTEEYEELRTGERCLRIQGIIGRGADAGGRLGIRDQRRVSTHITRCQPCRKQAVMAGLDVRVIARHPVRAKIAALLPLPVFVKRRWLGGGSGSGSADASAHAAHHAPVLAQASMAATQYGEPAMAGWMKATAVAAAVAVAGIGAGASDHATPRGGKHRDAPVVRDTSAGAPPSSAGVRPPSAGRPARSIARPVGARSASSSGSSAGRAGAWVAGRGRGTTTGAFSGGTGGSSSSGSASGGSGATTQTASPAVKPSGAGAGSPSASGSGATSQPAAAATVTGAVDDAAGAVTDTVTDTTSATTQPLVNPDLEPLTQPASTAPPQTAGAVVSTTADAVGGTVGGRVGEAVKDTGGALGDTVDQVTQGVKDATGPLLGGGK